MEFIVVTFACSEGNMLWLNVLENIVLEDFDSVSHTRKSCYLTSTTLSPHTG